MQNFLLLILSVSLTAIFGIIGYFLRSLHIEVKQFIKELTDYTNKLKQLIVGIQTQIDKSIETDISEIKADIKSLYKKTQNNTEAINQNRY